MGKSYVTEQAKPIERVINDLMITQLPAGYREVDHIQRVVDRNNTVVDQFIFSDGIGSVSVFIEPVTKGKRLKKVTCRWGQPICVPKWLKGIR